MSATRVDTHVLCAGIASFFMLALAWAFAYVLLDRAQPGSFQLSGGADSGSRMVGFTAVYFSMVTLCTVGFGDITPVSSPARMLAMMEGATGVFFVAVMVARLVSMYSTRQAGTDASSASS